MLNATTGAYTYTLDTAFTTSPAADNGTNLEDNRDSFSYTVTDANGNSTTGVINVDIIDDVPVIFYPDSAASLNGNSAPTTATLNLGNSIGADGLGSIVFDITEGQLARDINGLNLTLGGQQLYLHGDGTSVLTATTSATTGGTLGYTVTIDAATGNYVFDVDGTISNGTETSFSNLTSSAAGNVQFRGIEVGPDATPIDVLLSASSNGAQATVNTDSDSIGINNQSIGLNEAVRIDLVNNLVVSAGTTSGFGFQNYAGTTHFEQFIPQVGGSPGNTISVLVSAVFEAVQDQTFGTNPLALEAGESLADITQVTVNDYAKVGNTTVLVATYTFTPGSGAQGGFSVQFIGDQILISGLQSDDQYEIDTATNFNTIIVESPGPGEPGANSTTFDLGVFSVGTASSGTPIDQSFNIVATDADGDVVNSTIQTTIVPVSGSNSAGTSAGDTLNGSAAADVIAGNAGNDTINGANGSDSIYGNGGNDVLNGGDGNDLLAGGTGNDTLTGGTGADNFVIDVSALSGTQADNITDYAAGEVIDITQLLNTGGSLSGFVRLTAAGQLQVDANGGGNGFVTVATLAAGVNATIEYATSATTTATVAIMSGAPPVVLDLDGDGVEYLGLEAGVIFDYGGGAVSTAWVGADDGLLIRDANNDGAVSGSELVFAGAGSDLDGLSAYDSNGDGVLSSGDADFGQFGVWQDANSDGTVDGGELVDLTAAGISSISLASNGVSSVAADGDVLVAGEGSYTYVNDNGTNSTGLLADVTFRTARDADQAQRISGAANNTGVVGAAVAAMGLMAGQAAAHVAPNADEGHVVAASSGGPGQQAQPDSDASTVGTDASRSLLSGENHVTVDLGAATAARSVSTAASDAKLDVSSVNEGQAPVELLSATEPHANDAAGSSPVAPMIVMPSVAALEAMAGEAHGNGHGGTVANVIAAALEGGAGGGDIDALLAALPGGDGENAALEALATPHGEAVPGWDMGHFGHLQAGALMNIVADVSALHHDAVQPAING